jgi:CubicO group peptidase (beta-lactamase class C family)
MDRQRVFSFLYLKFVPAVIFFLLTIWPGCSDNPTEPEGDEFFNYVSPEAVGYSSQKLEAAKQFATQSGYAAVIAVYDGNVFFSWGNTSYNYKCHSIRKPFLSALYGIHVQEDGINLDASLDDLGIDDIPPSLTIVEKQATVRELMQSRSGVYHEAAAETEEMKEMRPERGSHPPGTFFYYNNWDFNALGSIFEQETGTKIFTEFKDRIADPIGMEDFNTADCYYQYENTLSIHPAYSFRMSARDMARFGVLYQKNGMWKDKQIIPAGWITESTTTYSIMDSTAGIGYGYMWATIPEGSAYAGLVGAAGYYHTGIGVHALIILPEIKLVIVERYDTDVSWTDPGDAGLELGLMIINAKLP